MKTLDDESKDILNSILELLWEKVGK
jgi:hypothetical protein